MTSKNWRLDRFLSQQLRISRKAVKPLLAQQRVFVDGEIACDVQMPITPFSQVVVDDDTLQEKQPLYIMLNKPANIVSATIDDEHTTVIDILNEKTGPLIDKPADLHIAGRLDLKSTGLLLLTNDGRWSRRLSAPENEVTKRYRVTVANPMTPEYVDAFAAGMAFSYEGITTKPAVLKIISPYIADVTLIEGRYHQIKRMFGRFRNPVLALHRYAIGNITLDSSLTEGGYRLLNKQEVTGIAKT